MSNASQTMQGPSAGISGWIARHADAVMATAIGVALASKLLLAFRINIHWDEFYFLSLVHEYARGDLALGLQTFHVHLFSWLARLDGEVSQVMAARLVMAALAAGSALAIYGIARHVAERSGALFAVLGYLALSVVVEHGASFRTDPIATFLALAALYFTIHRPGSIAAACLAGVSLAIAALVTIKTAFFLPLVPALIWCLVPGLRTQARMALASGGAFLVVGGLLYLLHVSSLAPADRAVIDHLPGIASKVFFADGVFARWADFLMVVALNPLFWIMSVEAAIFAWRSARTGQRRADWLPLALALPALTPLIYRNAFQYYFPVILAPAAILLAIFYEKHRLRAGAESRGLATIGMLILVQCGFLAIHVARNLPDEIAPQRSVLAAIHATFPRPVPYIGGYGVVATFPRQGFFMSSWGMEDYRRAGRPVFPDIVARTQPPMLLADSPALYGALIPGIIIIKEKRALLPADARFIKENYVTHWGMLFVAGKQLAIPAGGRPVAFDIVVAGDYRLESPVPVSLDGRQLQPGSVVMLAIGPHEVAAAGGPAQAIMRWARALPPPEEAPIGLLTFFGVD
jgi:hypothetical protein